MNYKLLALTMLLSSGLNLQANDNMNTKTTDTKEAVNTKESVDKKETLEVQDPESKEAFERLRKFLEEYRDVIGKDVQNFIDQDEKLTEVLPKTLNLRIDLEIATKDDKKDVTKDNKKVEVNK